MEQYIQPFISVTRDVFDKFVGHEVKAGYPFFVDKEEAQNWDVSGVIGLTGEAKGAVSVSMKTDYAILLTGKLTGKQHTYLDEEVLDAVGEIVNIIAGNAKQKLEDTFNLTISLPSIVKGKGHAIVWSKERARIMCIPFTAPGGHIFHLSVALAPAGAGA
jgi:chemotaxis protein CheX